MSRIEVITVQELDAGLERSWRACLTANPDFASPFFTPDFARIVGEVRADTRIAVISDATGPVGFLPYHIQRLGRAAPLAGQVSDYHGIVGSDGGLGPTGLLQALGAQAFDFNHVPGSQAVFRDHSFLQKDSPLVDLRAGFERWREDRRAESSAIKTVERKGRKFAREVGTLRFVVNDTDPTVWARLLDWKRKALAGIGVDLILDRAWAGEIVDRVRATDTPGFGGMTSTLWAGEELAAVTFSIRTATTVHSWFPTFNPAFERYSPGLSVLMDLLRHAGEAGYAEVDLGAGTERYKREFANGRRVLCEGSIERPLTAQGLARKARKTVQTLVDRVDNPALADTVRRAGNRLLSAGRVF